MPLQLNGQLHSRMATRIWFQRDPLDGVNFGAIGLGILPEASAPTNNVESENLVDPANNNQVVWEVDSSVTESWSVKTANLSMENLALYFQSSPPTQTAQAATPLVDVTNANAVVGGLVKLRKADGDSLLNIASIEAVKIGASTLVRDTDYTVEDLEAGFIRLLETGDTGSAGQSVTLLISATPNAVTLVSIKPQTVALINGTGFIQMQSPDGSEKWWREARMSLRASTTNFSSTSPSDIDFTATILSDATDTSKPAGELTKFKGAAY